MKRGLTLSLISLVLLAVLSTACAGGTVTSSWPGLTLAESTKTVYLANQSDVFAINAENGVMLWRFPEKKDGNKHFYTAPVLTEDGQQLIAPGYDFKIYSLDPKSGMQKWVFEGAKGRYVAAPLVKGETIYAPNSDDKLYALDLNGKQRWVFSESKQALWAKPLLVGKNLIQPGMDHSLYAVDAQTGKLVWKTDMGGAMVSTPVLLADKNLLIVGTFNKEMLAVNLDGKIQWRVPTLGWVWSSPVLENGQLFFGDNSGAFYALDATNGKTVWQIQPGTSPIVGKPLYTAEKVFFGTEAGALYAVNMKGEVLWNHTIGGKLTGDMVLSGENILVAPMGMDAMLIAVDVDGNQKWSFTPEKN